MLRLTRPYLSQMIHHLQAVYPQEGCGILSGIEGRVTGVYPIDNILQSQTAYEMDPLQQVKTMLAIEAQDEQLCAIYHSHPSTPAYPSATDVALAYYPDAVHLIVSLQDVAEPVWKGYWIVDGVVRETAVIIDGRHHH